MYVSSGSAFNIGKSDILLYSYGSVDDLFDSQPVDKIFDLTKFTAFADNNVNPFPNDKF